MVEVARPVLYFDADGREHTALVTHVWAPDLVSIIYVSPLPGGGGVVATEGSVPRLIPYATRGFVETAPEPRIPDGQDP